MNRRKWIIAGVVALLALFLFNQPAKAAEAMHKLFDGLMHGASQLSVFASHLL